MTLYVTLMFACKENNVVSTDHSAMSKERPSSLVQKGSIFTEHQYIFKERRHKFVRNSYIFMKK